MSSLSLRLKPYNTPLEATLVSEPLAGMVNFAQVALGNFPDVVPERYFYFPMQKVLKIKLRMSSVVVAPVISSRGRRAP